MDYNSKIVMLKGADGADIKEIKKTSTSGLNDTYTITLTDGRNHIINVTNGNGIAGIAKTGTSGLVDTYTITYNDGTTSTFTVTNGEGVQNLQVGGRNLYTGTREFEGIWDGKDKWNFLSDKYNGFRVASNKVAWNGLGQYIMAETGGVYTLSAYINAKEGATFYAENADKDGALIDKTNGFKRIAITFTASKGGYTKPRIEERTGTADNLQIYGIKLERGNVATDWTPAPEDLETVAITNSDIDTILNS